MISTVDPQALHTRKSKSWRRHGFRGHVAAELETGLVTGCEMTMAAGPGSTDAENGVKMATRDRFTGTPGSTGPGQEPDAPGSASPEPDGPHGEQAEERLEIYGDSSYGSGEARAVYLDTGHDTVISPGRCARPCPAGSSLTTSPWMRSTGRSPASRAGPISKTRTVTLGAAWVGCPLRQQCTTAKDGRSMTIHPHEDLLRAARAQARTDDFKKAYPTRSAIERIISWTATQNGRRVRLRYLGTAKNNAWLHTRCAAINLRTLLRHGLTAATAAGRLTSQHLAQARSGTQARPARAPTPDRRGGTQTAAGGQSTREQASPGRLPGRRCSEAS